MHLQRQLPPDWRIVPAMPHHYFLRSRSRNLQNRLPGQRILQHRDWQLRLRPLVLQNQWHLHQMPRKHHLQSSNQHLQLPNRLQTNFNRPLRHRMWSQLSSQQRNLLLHHRILPRGWNLRSMCMESSLRSRFGNLQNPLRF